jgi:hypothetical protein
MSAEETTLEAHAAPATAFEVWHAARACCPCGETTDLVRCDCAVSATAGWNDHKNDPHIALARARDAIQPHLDATGHRFPVLEHRFVLSRAGSTQDFRTWEEAVEAGRA